MAAPWLLLIHQIPPKPDYLRVKVGRRLQRIGAVAIKSSVYVLPATEQSVEDFQWVRREIVDGGGDAAVCRAEFVDGLTDDEVERLFQRARARDYEAIAAEARRVLESLPAAGRRLTADRRTEVEGALAKLRTQFAAVSRIDFFETEDRRRTRELLGEIDERLRPPPAAAESASRTSVPPFEREQQLHGRTWVTREGVFVDRIASAWLIRRFIDPEARFKFVPPREQRRYRASSGELRFDMADAEYTHEGDRCTFETLVRRFGLEGDAALAQIGEIVHDIDLKDGKFGREDAVGIERVLEGIAAAHPGDAARLERGGQLFDELYALLRSEGTR